MEHSWETHRVLNQFTELTNYNLFTTDNVLKDYFQQKKADWATQQLSEFGAVLGTAEVFANGQLANEYTPVLKAFDNRGNRIDAVEFHPSWHIFSSWCKSYGLISSPFESNIPFRWSYTAANFILQSQVEAGAMCPATMTLACIPLIAREPELWHLLKDKLLSRAYDQRDIPIAEKKSVWIGMGMTEKQGGSDVRTNTTIATPIAEPGRGKAYLIRGHKWFFSAPMCDAHLVVARTSNTDAICCFYVPRWKPDGTKNPIEIQRLKNKLGNKSNSSSEVEFKDAYGILMGEEGRGIPTIIEMANYTRLCCVLGSTGIIRQATVQSIAYARKRKAFGNALYNQPLMKNVLVDFALESEAAEVLSLKLAEAFEQGDTSHSAKAWKRFVTPAAKYWVCKRAESLAAEAMEVFGGNGYVEDGIMARLYREAPVNSIWEGSGNVMCLDVLRAMHKEPEMVTIILQELAEMAAGDEVILKAIAILKKLIATNPQTLEATSRLLTEKLMLIVQACLLKQHSPNFVSQAFIEVRLNQPTATNYGAFIVHNIDSNAILERAFPLNIN